jgi:hypothetical protein
MPTPSPNESHDDFIDRCIPVVIDDGTADEQDQAMAICESIWRENESEAKTASASRRYVTIRGAAKQASIRTAKYQNRDHFVVPVVAMMGDAVVRPLHSEGPEFVPSEELAMTPAAWDNRPCLPDHPADGRSSANTPETLERCAIGQMFYTRYENGRLQTEAWLDNARSTLGGEPARVLGLVRRAAMGEEIEPIEVSVGAWVTLRKERGTSPGGQPYEYVWTNIVPDHLAIGLNGSPGACSVDMGCGAPRAATKARHGQPGNGESCARAPAPGETNCTCHGGLAKRNGETMESETNLGDKPDAPENIDVKTGSKAPERSVLRATSKKADKRGAIESDNLYSWLQDALQEKERGFDYLWVESFDTEDSTVVYSVRRDGEVAATYRRGFEVSGDGETIEVSDQRVAVRRRVSYEEMPEERTAKTGIPGVLAKVLEAAGLKFSAEETGDGTSDVGLREAMWKALRAAEPAFSEIVEIFPETYTVIYLTVPDEEVLWWRQSYSFGDDGELNLNNDRERIEPVTRYEPVRAAVAGSDPVEPQPQGEGHAAQAHTDQGDPMDEKVKEIVGRLIANEATLFTDEDAEALAVFGEEKLAAMEARYAEEAEAIEEAGDAVGEKAATEDADEDADEDAESAEAEEDTVRVSKEEWADVRAAADAHKAAQKAKKDRLVASLKAAQTTYSEQRLRSMSVAELEDVVDLLKLDEPSPDYSSRALARSEDDNRPDPPPSLRDAIRARYGAN